MFKRVFFIQSRVQKITAMMTCFEFISGTQKKTWVLFYKSNVIHLLLEYKKHPLPLKSKLDPVLSYDKKTLQVIDQHLVLQKVT